MVKSSLPRSARFYACLDAGSTASFRRRTTSIVFPCTAAVVLILSSAHRFEAVAALTPAAQRAPELRLPRKEVTVPIVLIDGYPFVGGAIAGVRGKLMLDTGYKQALTINEHRVPVRDARTIGTGHFGSGQTFVARLVPNVRDVRIGHLAFGIVTSVAAQDARLLETITPDFLGWFGYEAWAGHALKLDYRRLRATFYPHGLSDYLAGERVVAELEFTTRKLPNHPIVAAHLGDQPLVTVWDTGQYGALSISEADKVSMLVDGRLTPSAKEAGRFDIHGLRLGAGVIVDIAAVEVETTPFAAAGPIGITEPQVLTIGYGLLRQYKTVWDFERQRLWLLQS